jgi:hypothetical protein
MSYVSDYTGGDPPVPVPGDPFAQSAADRILANAGAPDPNAPAPRVFTRPAPGDPFAGPMQASPQAAAALPAARLPTAADVAPLVAGRSLPMAAPETTIGAYDPTWRQWLAQKLYGDQPASVERAASIRGLLGTTGVGAPGPSLADFTPAGAAFAFQEGYRANNPQMMALAAAGFIPGLGEAGALERGGGAGAELPSFLRTGEEWRGTGAPPPISHNLPPPPVAPGPEAPAGLADRISTRVPYATNVDPAQIHANNDLQVGLDSTQASPEQFAKIANIIRNDYTGHGIPPTLNDNDTVEAYINHLQSNILAIHDRMDPDVRNVAKDWYLGANGIATQWAKDYGLTPAQTAAVIAAQSPQKDWYQNVSLAQRVLDINKNQQSTVMTPEMMAWGQKYAADKNTSPKGAARMTQFLNDNQNIPFSQITNPVDRSYWMRAYDEAHNDRGYDIYSPTGQKMGPVLNDDGVTPSKVGWGSFITLQKADAVLRDGSIPNISAQMGDRHKVRSFYNNIVSPNANLGDVTVDTHAAAGANFFPLTGNDEMTEQALGGGGPASAATGTKGLYGIQAEAWRRAAAERGVMPREMQSMVWEGTRSMFNPNLKADTGYRDAISGPWRDFHNGLLSLPDAQERAFQAATPGGVIPRPDWAGPVPAGSAAVGPAAHPGELHRPDLGRPAAEAAVGGAGGGAAGGLPQGAPVSGNPFVTQP